MLEVRYVGIAEAMGVDGRNTITLTNFDPAHLAFEAFPVTWPLILLGIFEDSEIDSMPQPGKAFTGQASLLGPDGLAVVTIPAAGVTQPASFADIPIRFVMGIGAQVYFSAPGNYQLQMTLSYEGQSVAGGRTLYVRQSNRAG